MPPIIVSFALVTSADLRALARGPLGPYLRRYMGPLPQLLRLALGIVVLAAAWRQEAWLIAASVVLVAVVWLNGVLWPRR